MVFLDGFMVDINGIIKVLIPVSTLKGFEYKANNSSFNSSFVKNTLEIKEGVELKIEIVIIKYEKKQYSCIGQIKN